MRMEESGVVVHDITKNHIDFLKSVIQREYNAESELKSLLNSLQLFYG